MEQLKIGPGLAIIPRFMATGGRDEGRVTEQRSSQIHGKSSQMSVHARWLSVQEDFFLKAPHGLVECKGCTLVPNCLDVQAQPH